MSVARERFPAAVLPPLLAHGLGQDLPLRSAYGEGYSLSASFNLS